jgi:hypothetical protein
MQIEAMILLGTQSSMTVTCPLPIFVLFFFGGGGEPVSMSPYYTLCSYHLYTSQDFPWKESKFLSLTGLYGTVIVCKYHTFCFCSCVHV